MTTRFQDNGKIRSILERLAAKHTHPLVAAGVLSRYVDLLAKAGIGGAEALKMFEEDFLKTAR